MHTREIIKTMEFSLCYRKSQHILIRGTGSSSALLFAGGFTRVTQPWIQAGKTVFSRIKTAVKDGQKH